MEYKKTRKTAFEIERDRRLKKLKDNSLWQILRERVKINGKPIAHRTARDVFSLKTFKDVEAGTAYRVWVASKAVIDEHEANQKYYGSGHKKVESSTTD